MAWRSTSRRRLLRRGGAALSAGALAGLAGCSGPLVGGGSGPPFYAQWLPAPGRVLRRSAEDGTPAPPARYPFRATDYADVAAYAADAGKSFDPATGYRLHPVLDLELGTANRTIRSEKGIAVFELDLSRSAIVEAFETDERFGRAGTYEGYDVLRHRSGSWTVGVADGTLVEAFRNSGVRRFLVDLRTVVERMVDAKEGRERRYVAASDPLSRLVDRFGAATFVAVTLPPRTDGRTTTAGDGTTGGDGGPANGAEGPVAGGVAYTIDGATTAVTGIRLFRTASDANFGVGTDFFGSRDVRDVEVSRDGRVLVAEGSMDTDRFVSETVMPGRRLSP